VYMAWARFEGGGANPAKLMFASSKDCGRSWSVKPASNHQFVSQGATIALGPNGEIYIAWREIGKSKPPRPSAIWFIRSTDGGRTFTNPKVVASPIAAFDQPRSNNPLRFRTNALPTIAAGAQGDIYVAWAERGYAQALQGVATLNGTTWKTYSRIVLAVSTNGGNSFATRYAIDDPPAPRHMVMPALALVAGKVTALYYSFVDDPFPSGEFVEGIQHLVDVWAAQADPGPRPAFKAFKVSSYRSGFLPDGTRFEQSNPPNLPLFVQGTAPFIGDYIDLAGLTSIPVQEPDGTQVWVPNTGALGDAAGGGALTANSHASWPPFPLPPNAHGFWNDNRDVKPPLDGRWDLYFPPDSPFWKDPANACIPARAGMRNTNIYTAQLTWGLVVWSPGNTKPLGFVTREDGLRQHLQRGFTVVVDNYLKEAKFYRLRIANQPGTERGDRATFRQFPAPPYPDDLPPATMDDTTIFVRVSPLSSIARTVYVTSAQEFAQVRVEVEETEAQPPQGGIPPLKPGGLRSWLLLNADRTNPTIVDPDSAAPPRVKR